jgi:hypothetical protein
VTGAVENPPTHTIEIPGVARNWKTPDKIDSSTFVRKKLLFFLDGEVYSLTRGLLMGDPLPPYVLIP